MFWRPEIAPAVVVRLAPAPSDSDHALSLAGYDIIERPAEEGLHVRMALGPQLLLPNGADPAQPLAAVVPLDDRLSVRSAAVKRLYDTLRSGAQPTYRLTAAGRLRFKRILRALDARAVGASYRDIAEHILGAREADSAAWRMSSARDVAIRLCRTGARLVRGGYLALLRRQR